MTELRRAMRVEPFWYCRFLKKSRKCYDIKKYRWTTSEPTGLARGVRSRLPLPDIPLPALIARSLKVPEETAFTTVVRLSGAGQSPDTEEDLASIPDSQPVILVMQSCSHDAPYGEYFRIQETLIFSKGKQGTDLKRWVSVLWVKSLPWALGALRNIIESQTISDSQKAHDDLVKYILQAAEDARD
ncbi:Voltage-dependent T-type calcium channel subunit alpha-1H [Durusdinium trenchii]